jgi:hypothetical protein
MSRARTLLVLVGLLGLVTGLPRDSNASMFGEENLTLAQQLAQLLRIRKELEMVSDGIRATSDAVNDVYHLYEAAMTSWERVSHYSTDEFLRDFRSDVDRHYPGLALVIDGKSSRRLEAWNGFRPSSSIDPYKLLSAVFADVTGPSQEQEPLTDKQAAEIWHAEAAGALALHRETETWLAKADASAIELAKMAESADLNPAQAQIVQARALALLAVQQSHTVRLLSRRARLDGVRGAFEYGRRARSFARAERQVSDVEAFVRQAPSSRGLIQFEPLW